VRVLAFDTCFNACSAAVLDMDAGAVVAARWEAMRVGHAERLLPMIEEVLVAARCDLADLDAIAVTAGPGTFTGIRVGIAAARGLALASGKPVVGTTSLALLAATARAALSSTDRSRPIAACHDARKGEVLIELAWKERANPPQAMPLQTRVRLLTPQAAAAIILREAPEALLVGSGAEIVAEAAAGTNLTAACPGLEPDVRHIAGLSMVRLEPPLPLYPRPPDAKLPTDPALARTP
jgi:tRNA threonylcarbamoyladenosine biosynthesis protein TsaB